MFWIFKGEKVHKEALAAQHNPKLRFEA